MSQPNSQPSGPIYRRPTSESVPARRFEGDLFEREELVNRLTGLLTRLPDGAVLSIDSAWGEGKTWLGKRWHASLSDRGYRTAYIDCFQRDYIGDPFAMLAGELLELAKQGRPEARTKLLETGKKIGAALLPAAAKFAANTVGHWTIGNAGLADEITAALDAAQETGAEKLEKLVEKAFENYEADKRSVEAFKKALGELAAESSDPVVIFVDELDRCRPDFAVYTIERIKHFFDVPGIVFVLLVNRAQLAAAIRGVYGQGVDSEAYLAKFIQLSLTLPKRRSVERHGQDDNRKHIEAELARYGFPRNDAALAFASAVSIFGALLGLSLRDMERAVALLSFAQPMGVSVPFVAWPIALKLAKPNLFNRLLAHDAPAHQEAQRLAADLKARAPDATWLLEFFQQMHTCGETGFTRAPNQDAANGLQSIGRGMDPRSYLSWLFGRIDLSVSP